MTTRIITGAVLAVLAVVLVVHGGLIYFFVMLALALLGLNEFYRLTKMYQPLPLAGFISVAVMLYMAWFRSPFGLLGALALAFLLVALHGPARRAQARSDACAWRVTLLGILYLGLGFSALLLLRRLDVGTAAVLTVVFGTWAGDTMAYFTGRFFGSTPMAPKLSPKKTWEGFAGGAIGTVLLVVFIGLYTPLGPADSLALGAVIAVVGPARRPLREPRQARRADQGFGPRHPRPRRRARPLRRADVDLGGGVLPADRGAGVLRHDDSVVQGLRSQDDVAGAGGRIRRMSAGWRAPSCAAALASLLAADRRLHLAAPLPRHGPAGRELLHRRALALGARRHAVRERAEPDSGRRPARVPVRQAVRDRPRLRRHRARAVHAAPVPAADGRRCRWSCSSSVRRLVRWELALPSPRCTSRTSSGRRLS